MLHDTPCLWTPWKQLAIAGCQHLLALGIVSDSRWSTALSVCCCWCACRPEDESDVVETVAGSDAWAAYCADGDVAGEGREPMFCSELGLAMETPRDGASIQQLWSIL